MTFNIKKAEIFGEKINRFILFAEFTFDYSSGDKISGIDKLSTLAILSNNHSYVTSLPKRENLNKVQPMKE